MDGVLSSRSVVGCPRMVNGARLIRVRSRRRGLSERFSQSWWVMDWLRALNFLFRGRPDAAFTLSDHFVKVSSRHGSDLWKLVGNALNGGGSWLLLV